MGLFKSRKSKAANSLPAAAIPNYSALAELTLNNIDDGVLLIDDSGLIKFANPAAANMMGYGSPSNLIGLNYQAVLRLETTEGSTVPPDQSKVAQAVLTNQSVTLRDYVLISAQSERRAAIAITVTPTGGQRANKIITFRDITKELEEEQKQSEFISTASHEMRTPVASIEGYLGLALNPQTATIDERARQYLQAAHTASQHLGHLFKDLLDVTKLDDGRMRVHEVPVDIVAVVREMAASREKDMRAKHLKYSFGTTGPVANDKKIDQLVYAAVDLDFLREILDNLIDNAIKYTPEGGEIWINARGDGDKVLINVTDTGIGVSPDDAGHIFQKFYRVDNSQTRQIGGTGLGLYLVKQRVEAMGGRVWVESAFGDGSTFYVSLPRLTPAEYRKRLIVYQNEQAAQLAKQKEQAAQTVAQKLATDLQNNTISTASKIALGRAITSASVPAATKPAPASQMPPMPSAPAVQVSPTQSQMPLTQPAMVQPQVAPVPAGPVAEMLAAAAPQSVVSQPAMAAQPMAPPVAQTNPSPPVIPPTIPPSNIINQ